MASRITNVAIVITPSGKSYATPVCGRSQGQLKGSDTSAMIEMIDRLLLERSPLAGIARVRNVTLVGSMSLNGIVAALTFEGGINGDVFKYFVEQMLVPNLWVGACVVMDNLSSHGVEGVRELIEAAGARLVYLSPYSPDFNPIENGWSKVKAFLRSVAARSCEALDQGITDDLKAVTLKDIEGWFTYRCYCT